jgi:mannose-6-phosphate isomerase-like protein (cupin superfamily)
VTSFVDYRDHVGVREHKHFKSTLFMGENVMLGLNCLEPGQRQSLHAHAGQDKFYFVLEGRGDFAVGDERETCGPGQAIFAAAGVDHGVQNRGADRLVLLVGLSPPPAN